MHDSSFFQQIAHVGVPWGARSINVPLFYYDISAIGVAFLTPLGRIRARLPSPRMYPLRVTPWHGLTTITAYEYRDCDIGPYNEIAISFPVTIDKASPVLAGLMRKVPGIPKVYTHHLPVTTEIARDAGVEFANYPKFLADITIEDKGERIETTLKEKDDLILKMSAKKMPLKKSGAFEFHTFSIKDNEILHTLIEGKAERIGYSMMGKFAEIELGNHDVAKELKELNLGEHSHSGQYTEGAMSKLHHPDKSWNIETLEQVSES